MGVREIIGGRSLVESERRPDRSDRRECRPMTSQCRSARGEQVARSAKTSVLGAPQNTATPSLALRRPPTPPPSAARRARGLAGERTSRTTPRTREKSKKKNSLLGMGFEPMRPKPDVLKTSPLDHSGISAKNTWLPFYSCMNINL